MNTKKINPLNKDKAQTKTSIETQDKDLHTHVKKKDDQPSLVSEPQIIFLSRDKE